MEIFGHIDQTAVKDATRVQRSSMRGSKTLRLKSKTRYTLVLGVYILLEFVRPTRDF